MPEMIRGQLLLGNNQNVRVFKEEEIAINRKPICEYDLLSILGIIANSTYIFDLQNIGSAILPKSIMAYKSAGVANNENIILKLLNDENQQLWEFQLQGKFDVLGNSFFYTFPEIPIPQDWKVHISSNSNIDLLIVNFERTFVNKIFSPSAVI